jgi:hypothetical protein
VSSQLAFLQPFHRDGPSEGTTTPPSPSERRIVHPTMDEPPSRMSDYDSPLLLLTVKSKQDAVHVSSSTWPTQHHTTGRRIQSWGVVVFVMAMLVVVISLLSPQSHRMRKQQQNHHHRTKTVCVSGGGFSGFWFTLGRLQNSIILPTTTTSTTTTNYGIGTSPTVTDTNTQNLTTNKKEYYCYSSGCLGVVAALSRYNMEDMWNIAHNIQLQWKSGSLDRYDVVTTFVDDLLFGRQKQPLTPESRLLRRNDTVGTMRLRPSDLSSLNIITSVKDGWWWNVQPSIRTPQSISELRTMLIQTTWIPFAIGNDLWYDHHMDGAFTASHHPKCHYNVGFAFDWDLVWNVINVNLGREKVEQFWKKGLAYGL